MIVPANPALIVGDMQKGILASHPFARQPVPALLSLLPAARANGLLVIFVRTHLRPTGADVSANNPLFQQFHQAGNLFHEGAEATEIAAELEARADEAVVGKRRTSAFAGTDLDLLLRAGRIDSLVLTGVATSAMVAATLIDALDLDYRVTVVSDACADAEPDVHDFFMERVFPARGAQVTTSRTWIEDHRLEA
ncbi:cysteine hydrolase family protein [Embleya scabrispora]|uniref:cysteine hydrolase family protein n=1 Tax=Embleya scabrispora TaxID=159449 RepID=UPI00037DDED9|nr:cysteine hydrolase [Embleya scabrispora]MYS85152.1 isochorismatase family protein [Streptomyces sp. SID5474]